MHGGEGEVDASPIANQAYHFTFYRDEERESFYRVSNANRFTTSKGNDVMFTLGVLKPMRYFSWIFSSIRLTISIKLFDTKGSTE